MIILLSTSDDGIYDVPKTEEHKYVSKEVAAFIKKTQAGIFKLFPEAKKKFKGVRYTKRVTSSLDPFDRTLRVSTMATGGTVAEAQRIQSQGNKSGYMVHDGPHEAFTSLIVHETAHFIDHAVKLKFKNNDDVLIEYQQAKRALRKQIGNPSPYAETHEGEWFAEQFTVEYMGKGDGPLFTLLRRFYEDMT
jgi:hypothetical protein